MFFNLCTVLPTTVLQLVCVNTAAPACPQFRLDDLRQQSMDRGVAVIGRWSETPTPRRSR